MDIIKILSEHFRDIFGAVKQRASSPIVGTFFISWVLINWKLVYYFLFSSEDVADKIRHIELYYIDVFPNLCLPLAFTATYIIFYPLLLHLTNPIWVALDNLGKRGSSYFIKNRIPISKEDQRRLFESMASQEARYKAALKEKDDEIDSLTQSLNYQTESLRRAKNTEFSSSTSSKSDMSVSDEKPTLIPDMYKVIESVDGKFRFEDLLAREMDLDKDDTLHSRELSTYAEIIKMIVKRYPEPWKIQELSIVNGGRLTLATATVHSNAKKLISKGWLIEMDFMDAKSLAFTDEFVEKLNSVAIG